jgi:hypothetical protein
MKNTPPPAADIVEPAAAPPGAGTPEAALDQQLRTMFSAVESAPVPAHLVRLADALNGSETPGGEGDLN